MPLLWGLSISQKTFRSATAADLAYENYRKFETAPPYDLEKVKALIDKEAELEKAPVYERVELPKDVFDALPFKEKFTYVMIHPEAFDQNCSDFGVFVGGQGRILGWLPTSKTTMRWSTRQNAFLHDNAPRVIPLLKQEIDGASHVGLNLKLAVIELDAFSLIPSLVVAFNRNRKDLDILTVLANLMKEGHYIPFERTLIFKKLYGPRAYDLTSIAANEANEDLIIDHAETFCKSRGG